jgi:2-methylcitrate dehydratase PrpD
MAKTIIERLASFTADTNYDRLPDIVVQESKRIILDSFGCALAAIDEPKGHIGIDYGRMLGGTQDHAHIIGFGAKTSVIGAAFANAELINALDFDAVLPPGPVTPYVLPGALAIAESRGSSGKSLLEAVALSHEMSYRIGKAMDYLRDTKDGKVDPPKVYGYSSTIFGATAAIMKLKGLSYETMSEGLGIAGCIAPVNSQVAWFQHAPSSTLKYLLGGLLAQSAMTAAHMGELGHRGDKLVLDDREYGFARFIGTRRWEAASITDGLGAHWRFTKEQAYKPYPHCRILHALLDTMTEIMETNDIRASEIEHMKAWVEGFVEQPVWLNRDIAHVHDAQFSIAHGLAMGAQRIPPGKRWQDPDVVFSPAVLRLMDKIEHEVHPDYVQLLTTQGASRPARLEIRARGQVFAGERRYPKGSPSPEPGSRMSDAELIEKFERNAEGAISNAARAEVIDMVMNIEDHRNIHALMGRLAKR